LQGRTNNNYTKKNNISNNNITPSAEGVHEKYTIFEPNKTTSKQKEKQDLDQRIVEN
jgi:hypothetical protein